MPKTRKRIPVEKNEADEKVAAPEEKAVETKIVPKRVQKVKPEDVEPPPPEKVAKLKKAHPSDVAQSLRTTVALKTASKFCGQWFHLIKGKSVTATEPQIAYLRSCGLVE